MCSSLFIRSASFIMIKVTPAQHGFDTRRRFVYFYLFFFFRRWDGSWNSDWNNKVRNERNGWEGEWMGGWWKNGWKKIKRNSCSCCFCAARNNKGKVSRYLLPISSPLPSPFLSSSSSSSPPISSSYLLFLHLQALTTSPESLNVATATCCTTPASFLAVRRAPVIKKRELRRHRQAKRAHSALASICWICSIVVIPTAPSQRRTQKISEATQNVHLAVLKRSLNWEKLSVCPRTRRDIFLRRGCFMVCTLADEMLCILNLIPSSYFFSG